jgi:uncharacterized protein (TIGR00661 family)
MVKVLVTLAGIGYGHVTRVDSLLRALEKKIDCEIEIMAYGPAVKYFSKRYRVHSLLPHRYVGDMSLSFLGTLKANWKFPVTFRRNSELIENKIKSYKPNLVITDGEFGANTVYGELKKKGIKVVSLHNLNLSLFQKYSEENKLDLKLRAELYSVKRLYNWLISASDLVIVPSFSKIRTPIKKVKNVGLMVRKYPRDLPSRYNIMVDENIPLKNVVVQIGGTKIGERLVRMFNAMSDNFSDYFFSCFSGKIAMEKSNFKYVKFDKDIFKYIKASEFGVSLAGHSFLSDALAFNLPVFVVPIRGHLEQLVNSWYLAKKGLAYQFGPDKALKKDVLKKEFELFISKVPKIKRKLLATEFSNGSEDAAKEILKLL